MNKVKNWVIIFLMMMLIVLGYFLYHSYEVDLSGKVLENENEIEKNTKIFNSEVGDRKFDKKLILGWWKPFATAREENMDDLKINRVLRKNLVLREDLFVGLNGYAYKNPNYRYNPKSLKPLVKKREDARAFFHKSYRINIDDLRLVDEGDIIHHFEVEHEGTPVGGFEFIRKPDRDIIVYSYNGVIFFLEREND